MNYRFIKIENNFVLLLGYKGGIQMVRKLRNRIISDNIYEFIHLVGPWLDDGFILIVYDLEESGFIRMDEEKLDIF
ncbi:hypothetical protein HPMBJEAJ_00237 [Aeromonas phage avDM6]|nr:hypothetical protein HPMBJEAJ_00237 [Aeromonas phage avDM6]